MADMKKPGAKKPTIKRPSAKPAPMPVAPKKPSQRTTRGTATPVPMPKKTPSGPLAIREYQRQVSPKGVKKAEEGAKKGLDKKYPGLYKNSK